VAPFLAYADRGLFFLCRTSNPGATTFQDLSVTSGETSQPLYLAVADQIQRWAEQGPATVGLVVGATYPAELAQIRERCPDLPILLPGIGAQGGDLEASLAVGLDRAGAGLLVSASRSVTYASQDDDFAARARDETRKLHATIAAGVEERSGGSPQVFRNDETGYIAWVENHADGYIVNLDTIGKRQSMIHTSRCFHLYPVSTDYNQTVAFGKACSTNKDALVTWAKREGHTIVECSSCAP
jgi:hypothetical protein